MKHIDEHILELYILRDEKVLRKKISIEKHLRECAGCRELAAKMQTLYADVEQELQNSSLPQMESTSKVDSILPVRIQETTPELWHKPNLPVLANWSPIQKWTPLVLQRFWFKIGNFVYQRPITATVGSLMFLSALLFFVNLGIEKTFNDDNPSYYLYSTNENKIEIYNKENQLLWFLPTTSISENSFDLEHAHGINQILIVDLDNDGKNEILTIHNISNLNKDDENNLLVYNFKGHLLKTVSINERNILFRSAEYNTSFGIGFLWSRRNAKNNKVEIYASSSNGRSPAMIIRFDNELNEIGKYWHFGNLLMDTIQIENCSKLIFGGRNDIGDLKGDDFLFMAIINPDSLIGNQESSTTKGFGYFTSSAEEYYIRFSKTDYEKILNTNSSIFLNTNSTDGDKFIIRTKITSSEYLDLGFEYIFSKKDLSVIEVKYNANLLILHEKLKKEGKLNSTLDKSYLEKLKNRVQYWDGANWQKTPTKINPNYSK